MSDYFKTVIITAAFTFIAWITFSPPFLSILLVGAIIVVYNYGTRRSIIPLVVTVIFAAFISTNGVDFLKRIPFLVVATGVTLLVGYIKNLNFRLQSLAWVVDSSSDAIISKGLDGKVKTWNKGAEKMLGWKESEMIGQDISRVVPSFLIKEELYIRSEAANNHQINLETLRVTKSNQTIDVALNAFPVKNQYGHIVGISTVMRDLTETKRAVSMAEAQFRGTPIPIFSWRHVDNDFELVDYNKAAFDITEGKISTLVGIRASALYVNHPEVIEQLNKAWNTKSTVRKEGPFRFITTGKDHYLDASFVFVHPDVVMIHAEDITARKNNEEVIRRGREQFRTIVEHAPNGMVVVDANGRIVMVNTHLENIFRYKRAELIGQPIEILIPDASRPTHRSERENFLKAPEARPMGKNRDLFGKRKDGTLFPVEVGLNPIETPEGPMVLGTVVDITERKEYENRIKQAREDAEQASKAKDEFLAVVSHELKTPLSSILGYSSLLTSGRLGTNSEAAKMALNTIERSARNQASLIEDLLDISRIVSGRMKIKQLIVGIPGIVHQACDQFGVTAAEKGVNLSCAESSDKLFVLGDPGRLQQILTNLLDNAVKFTPKGGKVKISIVPEKLKVHIVIEDTGVGIEPEFMKELFQRFKQESTGIRRVGQGLGLGLSIAKSLAELQNGTIEAFSEGRGKGAKFTVTLPLSSPPLEESIIGHSSHNEEKLSLDKLAIMVIDDDRDTLDMLKLALERFGAVVELAESAEEGRAKLETKWCNIIICDVGMPVVSGYEFIRALRDSRNDIPAIALTAFSGEEYAKLALEAGFNHYMSKPIEINDLAQGILYTLRKLDKL